MKLHNFNENSPIMRENERLKNSSVLIMPELRECRGEASEHQPTGRAIKADQKDGTLVIDHHKKKPTVDRAKAVPQKLNSSVVYH